MTRKMNKKEIDGVRFEINVCFNYIADLDDSVLLTDVVIDDVVRDIEETADDDFTIFDITIALTRVLKNKLGVE